LKPFLAVFEIGLNLFGFAANAPLVHYILLEVIFAEDILKRALLRGIIR